MSDPTDTADPIARDIWDMKYRFKDGTGRPIDASVEDTWRRVATALAEPESPPSARGGRRSSTRPSRTTASSPPDAFWPAPAPAAA